VLGLPKSSVEVSVINDFSNFIVPFCRHSKSSLFWGNFRDEGFRAGMDGGHPTRRTPYTSSLSGFVHFISALRIPLADLSAVRTCSYKSFFKDLAGACLMEAELERLEGPSVWGKAGGLHSSSRRQWDLKAFAPASPPPLRPRQNSLPTTVPPRNPPSRTATQVYGRRRKE